MAQPTELAESIGYWVAVVISGIAAAAFSLVALKLLKLEAVEYAWLPVFSAAGGIGGMTLFYLYLSSVLD